MREPGRLRMLVVGLCCDVAVVVAVAVAAGSPSFLSTSRVLDPCVMLGINNHHGTRDIMAWNNGHYCHYTSI